jgi:hypothetical protein
MRLLMAEIDGMKDAAPKISQIPVSLVVRLAEFVVGYDLACKIWGDDYGFSAKEAESLKKHLKKASVGLPQLMADLDEYIAARGRNDAREAVGEL